MAAEDSSDKAKLEQESRPLSAQGRKFLRHELSLTCGVLLILILGGLIVAGVEFRKQTLAALLWALACSTVGFVGGFLFAIPRVSRQPVAQTKATADVGAASASTAAVMPSAINVREFGLGINTNLEEISDWLTKILVGLGLVELRMMPEYLRRAGEYVGQSFGENGASGASVIVYFLALGFLCGYLLTRMFLGPAFHLADQATSVGLAEDQLAHLFSRVEAAQADSQAARELSDVNSDVTTSIDELSDPASLAPGRLEQLIARLEGHLSNQPMHRKLNIVLARLYAEGKKNFDEAIRVLKAFIERKVEAGQSDQDMADVLFNLACYYSLKMEGTAGAVYKRLEEQGLDAIKKSIEISPNNAQDVLADPDLKNLRDAGHIQALLQSLSPS